jgi:ubiquinone/menaquinone biosynthesis C-methylase UbiE
LIDREAGAVSERLVELAGVEPGSRVLDVAAGYGEPSPKRYLFATIPVG